MQLSGLHHMTAVTGQAAQNLGFYTQVLGLRLVKKTVNQDDVKAYHLFYADALGSAGTEVTFFDWPHAIQNQPGAGTIVRTALRVPSQEALHWWAQRLSDAGVTHSGIIEIGGEQMIHFADPEGQALALVNDYGAPGGTPWSRSSVPVEMGIRGLHAIMVQVRDLRPTAWVLSEVMGFERGRDYLLGDDPRRRVVVFATAGGGPGTEVHVEAGTHIPPGRVGRGGVHHIAFRTPNDEEHQAWRTRIDAAGLGVTPVIDRYYFKSIYFREPGGVLFEIATDGPGFAADEDPEHLGERLALPPFLEPRRQQIEAGLRPLTVESNQ
jgi:glyoxalase family protein